MTMNELYERAKRYPEIDIEYWKNKATALIGTTHDLHFQSSNKFGVKAGEYEIIDFEPYVNPVKIKNNFFECRGIDLINKVLLGIYKIKFKDTKKYNNKTYSFEVSAYSSYLDVINPEAEISLCISERKIEDGKFLQAYTFRFIETEKY